MPGDSRFEHRAVPLLRERAFNLRWAEQPADVIPLTAADPDFPVAPCIRERLARDARDGVFGYGPPAGTPEFREAVAHWMRTARALPCTAADVLATDGAASALALVAAATLEPGDEVLLPDPVDFLFRTAVERAGATPVPVPLDRATTGPDHVEALARRLTPRTRMLWLCNPHNPLGRAFGRDWLQAVGAWAVEHGLRILVDEVWSDIVYPPARHVSLASLSPAIAARVATVHGFSKGYGLAGLRIGCIVCTDERWREALLLGSGATSTLAGASVLSQAAAVAALDGGSDWLRGFLEHLRQQRDLAVARMARWPGVRVTAPESTFVLLADVRALTTDAAAWCETLRREARVALVPGGRRWFGEASEGHVRLSFATSREILGEALDRVEDWLRGRVG